PYGGAPCPVALVVARRRTRGPGLGAACEGAAFSLPRLAVRLARARASGRIVELARLVGVAVLESDVAHLLGALRPFGERLARRQVGIEAPRDLGHVVVGDAAFGELGRISWW